MKKFATIAAAIGLTAALAGTAAAADTATGTTATTSTVTGSTYTLVPEPVITPADLKPATPMIILTRPAAFYLSSTSLTPSGVLAPQTVDTTGNVMTDAMGNEWREIYTWLGKAWIKVPASAYVITP
ncbi:hypothetical protein F4V43_13655 [Paenibacillus spiritus]|uniref:SH3 domain-containing protein n=1 Tax=Paenibacillus spiritus TaxID=2496557 RepID=A0A5J5G544_9BACL|nr:MULTISPECIES: hypothetical protein [Paenibacillus]KAA9002100.1 hypothetical protein F4V43_13655 [Paenibacillus spiritus]